MNKKLFKSVLWLMIFNILAGGFMSAIAIFLQSRYIVNENKRGCPKSHKF